MFLGVDIGGTRIKAGLVDRSGALTRCEAVPTPESLTEFRSTLEAMARRIGEGSVVEGVGIGCKGIIRPSDTFVECLPGTLDYLEGTRLADFVSPFVSGGAVISADNDARAALAGEMTFGAAKGRRHALMLTLGTGVGGAVLSNGELLRGCRGAGGHAGHLTVDPDGPWCICGNRGCLETRFSSRAIELEAVAAIHRGCDSLLRQRYHNDPLSVTCEAVFACAAEGDVVARAIRDQALKYLSGALAGMLHMLDPEIVILGGQIAAAGEMLFQPLRQDVEQRTKRLLGRAVPIVPAAVGDQSGVVGAASLAMHSQLGGSVRSQHS